MNVKESLQSFLAKTLYASHYYTEGRLWSSLFLIIGEKNYCIVFDKEKCDYAGVWKKLDEFYSNIEVRSVVYESDDTIVRDLMEAYFKHASED